MSVSSDELLQLAKDLANSQDEVHSRCAAGRAYYSAFHALLPLVSKLPATRGRERADRISHAEVIGRLAEWLPSGDLACLSGLKVSAGVAVRELRAARTTRERADYDLSSQFPQAAAFQQIERARKLRRFVLQAQEELRRATAA